jgi:hypothetical protein
MAGAFSGYGTAKVSEQGTKCSDGTHTLALKRATLSRNGKNGTFFVVEFTVIASDSAKDATGRQKDPPGAERVWTQNMAKAVIAAPKCLAFLQAIMGYDRKNYQDKQLWESKYSPDDIEALYEVLIDESDPLKFKGRKVVAVTKEIVSNNHPFTTYDFSPADATKLET